MRLIDFTAPLINAIIISLTGYSRPYRAGIEQDENANGVLFLEIRIDIRISTRSLACLLD